MPWGERAAFLRNEQRHPALDPYARERRDPAIEEAVSAVLVSSGEPSAGAWGGTVDMDEVEILRIMRRAGMERRRTCIHSLSSTPAAMPTCHFECGETIARAFAAAEPETVTMYLDDRESELKHGGYTPGERYKHDLLRQYLPGFALARQWAGFDHDRERLGEGGQSPPSFRLRPPICAPPVRSARPLACSVASTAASVQPDAKRTPARTDR